MISHSFVKAASLVASQPPIDTAVVFGLDITYEKDGPGAITACSVFVEGQKKAVYVRNTVPNAVYRAGFLALKEYGPMAAIVRDVQRLSGIKATLLAVDGCGSWHPWQAGLASYLQVGLGIPAVGISKNYLFLEDLAAHALPDSELATIDLDALVSSRENLDSIPPLEPRGENEMDKEAQEAARYPQLENRRYLEQNAALGCSQLHFQADTQRGQKARFYASLGGRSRDMVADAAALQVVFEHKAVLLEAIRDADLSSRALLGYSGYNSGTVVRLE